MKDDKYTTQWNSLKSLLIKNGYSMSEIEKFKEWALEEPWFPQIST